MRKIILIFLVAGIFGGDHATSATSEPIDKECWSHVTNQQEGVVNTLHLCTRGDKASMFVEYPNVRIADPTTCRQFGYRKQIEQGFTVTLNEGQCENGRLVSANTLTCKLKSQSLICSDIDNFKYMFSESDGPSHNK